MKLNPKIAFLISAVYFSSCSHQPSVSQKSDSAQSPVSMAGKLYFFAPEFDSTKLEAMGDCDCCAANTLFLNDSSFLEIEYCDEGSTYVMGKYQMDDHSLNLMYDSVIVSGHFPGGEISENAKSVRDVYHVSIEKSETRTYQKQQYKGVNLFLDKVIGAPDKAGKFSDLLKAIHDEGVWEKLHTNPASVPRNSSVVEVFLPGTWARPGDTTACFKIMEDTICYFENFQKHPYKLNHDSLRILLAQNELVYPVEILGTDTLIFEGPDKQVYYRFNRYK